MAESLGEPEVLHCLSQPPLRKHCSSEPKVAGALAPLRGNIFRARLPGLLVKDHAFLQFIQRCHCVAGEQEAFCPLDVDFPGQRALRTRSHALLRLCLGSVRCLQVLLQQRGAKPADCGYRGELPRLFSRRRDREIQGPRLAEGAGACGIVLVELASDDLRKDIESQLRPSVSGQEREEKHGVPILSGCPKRDQVGNEALPKIGAFRAKKLFQLPADSGKARYEGCFLRQQSRDLKAGKRSLRGGNLEPCP